MGTDQFNVSQSESDQLWWTSNTRRGKPDLVLAHNQGVDAVEPHQGPGEASTIASTAWSSVDSSACRWLCLSAVVNPIAPPLPLLSRSQDDLGDEARARQLVVALKGR
jgi:hypothetical protein